MTAARIIIWLLTFGFALYGLAVPAQQPTFHGTVAGGLSVLIICALVYEAYRFFTFPPKEQDHAE